MQCIGVFPLKAAFEEITHQALKLPTHGSVRLAEVLLESLDDEEDFTMTDEWQKEIQNRCQELDDGSIQAIEGDPYSVNFIKRCYETLSISPESLTRNWH